MSEQSPQPQPDILTEAQAYDSFDAWLSQIPDERLQQVINVIGQMDAGEIKDEESFAQLIGVAMHFRGNQPMTTEEITQSLVVLATQVGMEANVRNDVISKQGEYSMHPDGKNARFTVTDKGKEIFGKGGA
jgi:hypothetical protein